MAAALIELAEATTAIRKVRAHTLPERNASTRVLQKLGFDRIGEAVDPEIGRVWRWERTCAQAATKDAQGLPTSPFP
jgi:[ribosomal protein S5]-alanine N-acetyltransferase